MTRTLVIASALLDTIRDTARRAYPNECCGLIEGTVGDDGWHATAVHETRNLSDEPASAFLIDPEAQFRLLRGLRGTDRAIVGCFHSHPEGAAQPSDRDRREAVDDQFLWLVAGGSPQTGFTIAAFVFDAPTKAFAAVALNRTG